jgi:prolyl 4-hydroxylase
MSVFFSSLKFYTYTSRKFSSALRSWVAKVSCRSSTSSAQPTVMKKSKSKIYKIDYSSDFTLVDCIHHRYQSGKHSEKGLLSSKVELPDDRDAHKFCTTIEGVFSSKECNKIVERSEQAGFKTALVNVGRGEVHDPDYRNSDRCIIDDCDIAKAIFERIKDFLPKILNGGSGSSWELVGVNERMRILRYSDGHFFAKHKDGSHTRNYDECTFFTLMIYLNSGGGVDFEGGSTNFLSSTFSNGKANHTEYVPKRGSVLVFDHGLLHEGATLVRGTKYCIRSDVLYKRVSYGLGRTTK